uniref:Uncharacterized protein n=1 Tax=Arundo donax TaxID=35708 RepID=A0A0A9GMI2_ARUDO
MTAWNCIANPKILEPDHATASSRRAGLDLIGSPPQRVEAVADGERGR